MTLRRRPVVVGFNQKFDALVVDPDTHMRVLILGILSGMSLQGQAGVGNLVDAVDHLVKSPTRFIVANHLLPGGSAIEFVQALRRAKDSPVREIPILVYGANMQIEDIVAIRDAGVNEIMTAPLTGQALQARVAAVLGRPRAFIMHETYVGPSRRRRSRSYDGADRRSTTRTPSSPEFTYGIDEMLGIRTADWLYDDESDVRSDLSDAANAMAHALNVVVPIPINAVSPGDQVTENIKMKNGAVAISKGTILSPTVVARLQDLVQSGIIAEQLPISSSSKKDHNA